MNQQIEQQPDQTKPNTTKTVVSTAIGTIFKLALLFGFLSVIYIWFGVFTIQPIGAIPDGVSIVYKRFGTNMDFIESPDGLSKRASGGVSVMGRLVAMGAFMKNFEDKIYFRMPYFKFLYLISTGGSEYDK